MKLSIYLLLIFSLFLAGCDKKESVNSPVTNEGAYKIPEAIDNDWETAHLTDVNMSQSIIEAMMALPESDHHSILIVKEGKLVYEEYFPGSNIPWNVPWDEPNDEAERSIEYTIETIHYQASATKSVVSALIGICLDQGLIVSVDQKIKGFFSQYEELFDEQKSEITLNDVLTMRSGIRWESDDTYNMDHNSYEWVHYVLSRPMAHTPGTVFRYNDGLSVMLAEIVQDVSGLRADLFAERYLFEPLGINNYYWMKSNSNEIAGGWGLYLRPRDMAKFGALFLQKGEWNGQTIVSESWVQESTRARVYSTSGSNHYGYQWWQTNFRIDDRSYETFFAWGAGSQNIYIIQELDLVVVFTAGSDSVFSLNKMYIEEYIIPACVAE